MNHLTIPHPSTRYNLWGAGVGGLQVLVQHVQWLEPQLVWQLRGAQQLNGTSWDDGRILLPQMDKEFMVGGRGFLVVLSV